MNPFIPTERSPIFVSNNRHSSLSLLLFGILLFFILPQHAQAGNLKVMKLGMGEGTIAVSGTGAPAIDCGAICNAGFTDGVALTFSVTFDASKYQFRGWRGDVTGNANPTTVNLAGDVEVVAIFDLITPFDIITDFSPGTPLSGIMQYLNDNPDVNTPARFLSALPAGFKQNWILMSRSESLQTGTAKYPRLLLPSIDARFVFSIGLVSHFSYPGSDPLAIEYMQWDGDQKNFRFHEIILGAIGEKGPYGPPLDPVTYPARPTRMISIDDDKCSKCHSTRNVFNEGPSIGTNGIPAGLVKVKNKPNWEAYDSWGGMMPFNRDRIYQGSLEDKAFRNLFNLWNWRGSAVDDEIRQVLEQLELQPPHVLAEAPPSPHRITRDTFSIADNDHIIFGYDGLPALTSPPNNYPPTSTNSNYGFGDPPSAGPNFNQGGRYITLRHTTPRIVPDNDDYNDPASDEGRAVRFFDALGGFVSLDLDLDGVDDGNFNAQRIADEIVTHNYTTGSFPVDVRPIALAITKDLLRINGSSVEVKPAVTADPLAVPLAFFNDRNGMTVDLLFDDTEDRTKTIPPRKADIQKINLDRRIDQYLRYRLPARPAILGPADGLFQEYDATAAPTIDQIRQEAFYRPRESFRASTEINGNVYVDREDYFPNTNYLTLFRYFLEPMGVSVDKWSMGVRGRSRAYAFADVFVAKYLPVFERVLIDSIAGRPVRDRVTNAIIPMAADPTDAEIINAVNRTLVNLELDNPVPKFTDVQRVFNKSCIECHGGLEYPPYSNYTNDRPGAVDFSEDETGGVERLLRSYNAALNNTTSDLSLANTLYQRIIAPSEDCPYGMMPCGGPALSQTDVETIKRWILAIPDSRPYTFGDPHIKTVDGVSYDFQAAGEYVLLRGDFFEVQTRHAAVATVAPYGPNRHTGLTSCVSINTAVAISAAGRRITYQPNLNGEPDPDGLQLRIDGKLVQLGAAGISLSPGSRIISTSAPGGIQVELAGGTVILITPWYWSSYQVWGIGIDLIHPRAQDGIMGAIPPGSWLPRLPDGTSVGPIPKGLGARFKILYGLFAEAWRVTDSISLFDYAPGTSTATYAMNGWPRGESPQDCSLPSQPNPSGQEAISRVEAEGLCNQVGDPERRELCILDIMATGEAGWAEPYLSADKILSNSPPIAPLLTFPENFAVGVTLPITFTWEPGSDPDGDPLDYKFYVWPVEEIPDNNQATLMDSGTGDFFDARLKCALIVALIGLLLWLILYFILRKKRPKLLVWFALLFILAAVLAYFLCGSGGLGQGSTSKTFADTELQSGRDYFWRVIVEDGNGGTVQSETRRFELK